MGTILDQMEGRNTGESATDGVRCPLCGAPNTSNGQCRHVRWTFDRGGPFDFTRYALSASPLTERRGRSSGELSAQWLQTHGEMLMDMISLHFGVEDGFLFGDIGQLDMFARDVWHLYEGESAALRR